MQASITTTETVFKDVANILVGVLLVKKPGTKILHADLEIELHKRLEELKGAGRTWAQWFNEIQQDFRKAREETSFYKDKTEFYERRMKNLEAQSEKLKKELDAALFRLTQLEPKWQTLNLSMDESVLSG